MGFLLDFFVCWCWTWDFLHRIFLLDMEFFGMRFFGHGIFCWIFCMLGSWGEYFGTWCFVDISMIG